MLTYTTTEFVATYFAAAVSGVPDRWLWYDSIQLPDSDTQAPFLFEVCLKETTLIVLNVIPI